MPLPTCLLARRAATQARVGEGVCCQHPVGVLAGRRNEEQVKGTRSFGGCVDLSRRHSNVQINAIACGFYSRV